ncbi:uncharacterized protein LOC114541014 isoform X2 [Dendronephthya gigantea]|uniref:uncharacterized protein LOC114541014 isoform X2 n=1 Tax=Dendronephthya gigantea TaxID=151771 RepID=UPI0010695316|nr:uncharacterized protein LOC114541014 isoform X2 [Dendronephthya gigantea]
MTTITDIKKRNEEKCKMAKGWKIPIAAIKPEALHIINDKFNLEWPIHESEDSGDNATSDQAITEEEEEELNNVEERLINLGKDFVNTLCGSTNESERKNEPAPSFLSPNTAKWWTTLTPNRKEVFQKGVQAGINFRPLKKRQTLTQKLQKIRPRNGYLQRGQSESKQEKSGRTFQQAPQQQSTAKHVA